MNIIITGPQGCGKGTQGERLSSILKIPLVTPGDMFRKMREEDTPLGNKIKRIMDSGKLVPNEITEEMVKERLSKEDCKKGFLLDGFPRNLEQARFLDKITKIEHVVVLNIPERLTIERMSSRRVCKKCGANYNMKTMKPRFDELCDHCGSELVTRSDDHPSAIKKRIELYHKETAPIIGYYKKKGIVAEIDGSQSIEEVQKILLRLLRKREKK